MRILMVKDGRKFAEHVRKAACRVSPRAVVLFLLFAAPLVSIYAQGGAVSGRPDGSLRGSTAEALTRLESGLNSGAAASAGSAGLYFALGFIHLLMFWFYPRLRANLYFSAFALGMALLFWLQFVAPAGQGSTLAALPNSVGILFLIAVVDVSLLVFLHTAFNTRVPVYIWLYAAARVVHLVFFMLLPASRAVAYLSAALVLFVPLEAAHVMARAVLRKVDGAWIVGLGVLVFTTAPFVAALDSVGVPVPWPLRLVTGLHRLGVIISSSIYLARNFARTNRELEAELTHVRELSERELELQRERTELALQNEQERSRRELIEQELALAADIQKGLFPEALPRIPGYDVAALTRPARVCGGDYYDIVTIDNTGGNVNTASYLLCVADVAGKGLPASLLMSNVQATLHALAGRVASLVELASLVNQRLYESSPSDKFVTAVLLAINPATGEGQYVNAGHNEGILLRGDGGVDLLQATGLPLGVMPTDMLRRLGKGYEAVSFRMQPDDLLALYSDGVPEAFDGQGQEWGEERLMDCLRLSSGKSARAALDLVLSEADAFVGTAPQHDDITLMIFKRVAPENIL
jgi:serine phosphatase RsbU (regulator of sigma subunit)